jgi:hypothetical protein
MIEPVVNACVQSREARLLGGGLEPIAIPGNVAINALLAASDTHEWADGYDGCGGKPIGSAINGSACGGRMNQYVYFASK